MSVSDEKDEKDKSNIKSLAFSYEKFLLKYPLLTKSVTSGIIFAAGDLLAQIIAPKVENNGKIILRSTVAFGAFGGLISGPLIHYFYSYLDKLVPKTESKYSYIYRVAIDRLLLAPPYLLLLFYLVPRFEGKSSAEAVTKIRENFMPVLKMNVKIWTIFQYININYIPQRYRVLFMCILSLVWNIYVAIKRR